MYSRSARYDENFDKRTLFCLWTGVICIPVASCTGGCHLLTAECPFDDVKHCEICNEQQVFKSKRRVEESRRLIEIYKALSSPTYILHSGAADPVLEAFKLSREMANLAIEDAPFKVGVCWCRQCTLLVNN